MTDSYQNPVDRVKESLYDIRQIAYCKEDVEFFEQSDTRSNFQDLADLADTGLESLESLLLKKLFPANDPHNVRVNWHFDKKKRSQFHFHTKKEAMAFIKGIELAVGRENVDVTLVALDEPAKQ